MGTHTKKNKRCRNWVIKLIHFISSKLVPFLIAEFRQNMLVDKVVFVYDYMKVDNDNLVELQKGNGKFQL